MSVPSPVALALPIAVGDRAAFRATISPVMVEAFAELSGDRNPLHVDAAYAAGTSFGEPIAHGMIAGALISRLIGMHLPGERALYRSQSLCFLRPILLGTEVEVRGEVIAVEPELALIRVRTEVAAAHGDERYAEGEAEVMVRGGVAEPLAESRPPCEPRLADPPRDARERLPARARSESADGTFRGERVLVIGGSRGLGAEIARDLGAAGAEVILTYRRDAAAASRVEGAIFEAGGRATSRALDLADAERVERELLAWDAEAPLAAVVLCAHGEIARRSLLRTSAAELGAELRRSAVSLLSVARGAAPGMRARRRGSIVALSSSVTQEVPPPGWGAYTAAKHSLEGIVRTLAVELAPAGIRVNAVAPTLIATEAVLAGPARVRDELAARSPLGRLPRPKDVAAAVRFLVSPGSECITGIRLPVAGGAVMP